MGLIISVDIPQCSRNSFNQSLQDYFGQNFLSVNGNLLSMTSDQRNRRCHRDHQINGKSKFGNIQCIHGQIMPYAYEGIHGARFITFIRNPVDRLQLHYQKWIETSPTSPAHQAVIDEEWSFNRFALGSEMQNIYHQLFWQFPPSHFDFIGTMENYDKDFSRVCHMLGIALKPFELKVSRKLPEVTPRLRKKIEQWHSKDINLWRKLTKQK